MFLFGIFSTHIPYVAFVAFFSYFFIFGIEKTPNEELQSGHSKYKIEMHSSSVFAGQNNISTFSYHQYYLQQKKLAVTENFVFKQKTKFADVQTFKWELQFRASLSNRPPPALT